MLDSPPAPFRLFDIFRSPRVKLDHQNAPAKKGMAPSGTRIGGDAKPSDKKAGSTSEPHCDKTQTLGEQKEDTATAQSHKRTFSNGPNQKIDESPPISPVPPPNKKAKCDPPPELASAGNCPVTPSSTDDDGEDLVLVMSNGPNVVYGWCDALHEFFEDSGVEDPFWLKSMVMDAYRAMEIDRHIEMPCVSITYNAEDIHIPETQLLKSHFHSLPVSDSGWYEVTLTQNVPEGKRMRVDIESGWYDPLGGIYKRKILGEWWMSDIEVAEGESGKAMETVMSEMF